MQRKSRASGCSARQMHATKSMTWQSLRVSCVLAAQRSLAVSASSTNFGSADLRQAQLALPAAACSQQILHVVFVGNRDRAVFGGRKLPPRADLKLADRPGEDDNGNWDRVISVLRCYERAPNTRRCGDVRGDRGRMSEGGNLKGSVRIVPECVLRSSVFLEASLGECESP
jgi:hypothetical protein